jgi:hypothetical protein
LIHRVLIHRASRAAAIVVHESLGWRGVQLADLVVGATREFINFSLGEAKEDFFGLQRFKSLIPHYINHPVAGVLAVA